MDEKLNFIMANQKFRQEADEAKKKAEDVLKTQQALVDANEALKNLVEKQGATLTTMQEEMLKKQQEEKAKELESLMQKQKEEFKSIEERMKKKEEELDKKARYLEEKNDQNVLNQRQTWQNEPKKASNSWWDWGVGKYTFSFYIIL